MKILIIEPDEYYHHQFARTFENLAEIVVAKSGARALAYLRDERPDALIMELLLADQSGYEFLHSLAELEMPIDFPIIVYSRLDRPEDIKTSLGLGVQDYFVKGRDHISEIKKLLTSKS